MPIIIIYFVSMKETTTEIDSKIVEAVTSAINEKRIVVKVAKQFKVKVPRVRYLLAKNEIVVPSSYGPPRKEITKKKEGYFDFADFENGII
jgi:hypothetical protein